MSASDAESIRKQTRVYIGVFVALMILHRADGRGQLLPHAGRSGP